jgi:hypothetical protein
MDKETYRQVVNALSVIGLTLEHADYLFDNDSKALKQVDEALMSAGIDAPMMRDRQVDRIIEDTVAFNADAFENMTSHPVTDAYDTHTEEEHLAEMTTREHREHQMRLERRSFEERRSFDDRRWTGRNGGDRRRDFTPTHHGVDTCEYE